MDSNAIILTDRFEIIYRYWMVVQCRVFDTTLAYPIWLGLEYLRAIPYRYGAASVPILELILLIIIFISYLLL
jgi:hypothetical protein